MGLASATVCYGTYLTRQDFPWDTEEFDGDYRYWWAIECGFKALSPRSSDNWHKEYKTFREANPPVPFELVVCGLYEYNSWILAVPGSETIVCHDDHPREIDLGRVIGVPEWRDYKKFIRNYFEDVEWESIKWYLVSDYCCS